MTPMGCGQSQAARGDVAPAMAPVVPGTNQAAVGDGGDKAAPASGGEFHAANGNGVNGKVEPKEGMAPKASPASSSASSSPVPATTQAAAAGAPRPPRMGPPVPVSVLTDSYKASHFLMYPDARLMVAYGEFRGPFAKDPEDSRFVFYGIRYIIENFVAVQWTEHDVELAAGFYSTHNAGFQPYPFPRDLFMKFVRENNGYFPVRIEALPEGTVANVHVPVYQIFAEGEYARLITFLETILTQVW